MVYLSVLIYWGKDKKDEKFWILLTFEYLTNDIALRLFGVDCVGQSGGPLDLYGFL